MRAIARVLAGDLKLRLIDEPTEGLAAMIVEELFALMAGLARDGIPSMRVEQNVDRAIDLASRFSVLERGRVVLEGRAGDAAFASGCTHGSRYSSVADLYSCTARCTPSDRPPLFGKENLLRACLLLARVVGNSRCQIGSAACSDPDFASFLRLPPGRF